MSWIQSHRRSAIICGLTLLLPLAMVLNLLLSFLGARAGYQSDIDRLLPRVARMHGLIGYEQQLRESSSQASEALEQLVYPASRDRATLSTALQTSVRQIFAEAGLSVTNSQALPVREEENFDYIAVRLTVTGGLADLDSALAAIAAHSPLLLVETLEVRTGKKAKKGEPRVILATVQVLSLRSLT